MMMMKREEKKPKLMKFNFLSNSVYFYNSYAFDCENKEDDDDDDDDDNEDDEKKTNCR